MFWRKAIHSVAAPKTLTAFFRKLMMETALLMSVTLELEMPVYVTGNVFLEDLIVMNVYLKL